MMFMTEAVLAVDLGGTKVLVQLSTLNGNVVVERRYISEQFASFDAILTVFFTEPELTGYDIKACCLAVAGPVIKRTASITNLPWEIDADMLALQFPLGEIVVCNDFEAIAYGIDSLNSASMVTLQAGELDRQAPRAIIGAGTGLGQAYMLAQPDGWKVVATEGGKVDFGPTDDQQLALWSYLKRQFGIVSYERILSGAGLVSVYLFLAEQQGHAPSKIVQNAISGDAGPAYISQLALSGKDKLATAAMALFMAVYGAQAGNLALSVVARGGVYIAGGIAAKNKVSLEQGSFMTAFLAKDKMTTLMSLMPVTLIIDEMVGLSGARCLALQSTV